MGLRLTIKPSVREQDNNAGCGCLVALMASAVAWAALIAVAVVVLGRLLDRN